MNNQVVTTVADNHFLELFNKIDFSFDTGAGLEVRRQAKSALSALRFPTSKDEYWKYTRVAPILKKEYELNPVESTQSDISRWLLKDTARLVFINGYFSAEHSDESIQEDLVICSLSEAKQQDFFGKAPYFNSLVKKRNEVFATLNSAFHNDGAFVHVAKNFKSSKSIHIIHLVEGNRVLAQPRNLIILDDGAEADVIETYGMLNDAADCLINSVSEVILGSNSQLTHSKVQEIGQKNNQIATEEASLGKDAKYQINTFSLSGALLRNNLNAALTAPNAHCAYDGLYLTKDRQHVDNHTLIDHIAPHCESHELYKGILNDRSTAVFNGRVMVQQTAQKTNAFQSNANILLSDDAKVNSKPELEIYADDVKCSHGSTTGQLDEEAIFYLEARGIEKQKARNLLLYAFAAETLENIQHQALKESIENYIATRYQNTF